MKQTENVHFPALFFRACSFDFMSPNVAS